MQNQTKISIENRKAAYAVLSTISESTKTNSLCEKQLVSLLKELNIGELKLLASRNVISINLDCERLSREMGIVKKIAEKKRITEELIRQGAPYNMMKYLGMPEREYREKRKTLNVSSMNRNRPKMATEEDARKIDEHVYILLDNKTEKSKAIFLIHKKSGVCLSKVWQHIKCFPDIGGEKN